MASITTIGELTDAISISLGNLSTKLDTDGEQLEFAASQALDEIGWTYPLTDGAMKFWTIQRGKRHAIDVLRTIASYKFKYKQISLNQRFDHLHKMIEQMDEQWKEALNTSIDLMDLLALSKANPEKEFGSYLGNGLIYDQYGNDISRLMKDSGIDNDGYRTRSM